MGNKRDEFKDSANIKGSETQTGGFRSRWDKFVDRARGQFTAGSMSIRMARDSAGVLAMGLATAGLLYGVTMLARPHIDEKADLFALNRPAAYTFVDTEGQVIGHHGPIVGERVKLAELPKYLPAAFMAMEDRNFYAHEGVDPRGLLRALVTNFEARDNVAGGSTITQQLVKILFLTPERTYERKFRELGGAWTLERKLSKDQILELYLNRIYLGSGAYGVDGASRVYFNKSARDVTLAEAAMLAALTRAPSVSTPRRDLEAAQERSKLVLSAMVETGAITQAEADETAEKPATIANRAQEVARNYYFDAAAEEVKRLLPGSPGDLTVLTTFDPVLQEAARKSVEDVMSKRAKAMNASQAALVSMRTDGAILALVGGRDYEGTQFNRVTQAKRQPGSAFKAFVYLAALEAGLSPWDMRDDGVVAIGDYAPGNYDGKHYGVVTLKEALTRSLNTVAIKLQQEVGVHAITRAAQRLGITSPLAQYASLALGTSEVTPLELTGAYAAFPTGGIKVTPYSVIEARTPAGEVVYRRTAPRPVRVIAEDKAQTMTAMLYEVVQHGTARAAILPVHEVAGKTGTSSEFRDAWFVGFTSDIVTGVWVGNDDFTSMKRVTGGSLPAQIWKGYMTAATKGTPPRPLPKQMPYPDPGMAYASYGDPGFLVPEQDASNGFYMEMPGFMRDLFQPRDDRDRREAREEERERERAEREERNERRNARDRGRGWTEAPYVLDRMPSAPAEELRTRPRTPQEQAERDDSASEPLATRRVGARTPLPPEPEQPDQPQNDAPFATRRNAPVVGNLEAQRRALAEREQAEIRESFEVARPAPPPPPRRAVERDPYDDMPPVDQPDPYVERDLDGERFARGQEFNEPMNVPDRDVYDRDLNPGYYEDEAPPPPPPPRRDPWFDWMR
jgi:penicillin-binding protein 1A